MVSIIIPSRNELFLPNTVNDILDKAEGEIEIIVILDGYWPDPPLKKDSRVKLIHRSEPMGMRNAINSGAAIAKGEYLMKCDAHCCFDKGFDVKLVKDCKKKNWLVVPRRHSIDKDTWKRKKDVYYDFQYISHPKDEKYQFKGVDWPEYGARAEWKDGITDLMTWQGSCWFMHKPLFEEIGGEDEKNYGTMGAEAQELCLKVWLSGGRVVRTKNTWYAHAKKRRGRYGYKKPTGEWRKSRAACIDIWTNNKWKKQTRELKWLINKFKPIPGWHIPAETVRSRRIILTHFKLNQANDKYPQIIEGLNREGFVKMLAKLGYKVGCEVGVEYGTFSKMMMDGIPGLKLYLIDPYEDYKGARKRRGKLHNKAEEKAHSLLDGHDVEWFKEPTETAFTKIPDKSLDFVYIDGNHKFDYTMIDIILMTRKVKRGGLIGGHDYFSSGKRWNRGTKCNVKEAVDAYVDFHRLSVEPWYLTDKKTFKDSKYRPDRHHSWFWIK